MSTPSAGGSPLLRALGLGDIGGRLQARRTRRQRGGPAAMRQSGPGYTGYGIRPDRGVGNGREPGWAPGRESSAGVSPIASTSTAGWEVLAAPRREARAVRLRRYVVVATVAVLVVTGGLTIAGQIRSWLVHAAPAPPAAELVAESVFAGTAVPFAVDYLSWDENDRPARQTALARAAAPRVTVDGWAGSGRQWADSPAEVGFVRGAGDTATDTAVVTVRVRVIPYLAAGGVGAAGRKDGRAAGLTGAPGPAGRATAEDAGGNVASGPGPVVAGWTPQQPRWLNLAVPVARQGERVVVSAIPALVGSPPRAATAPALAAASSGDVVAVEDTTFAQRTQPAVGRLLAAYGSGDLDYARAAATSFTGLNKAATLQKLISWRVREADSGDGDGTRVGDATVSWALSGGGGVLTCPYRVELHNDDGRVDGRWYLAAIGAQTQEVN